MLLLPLLDYELMVCQEIFGLEILNNLVACIDEYFQCPKVYNNGIHLHMYPCA